MARSKGWRARLNQARGRYSGMFQQHLNDILFGGHCPVNADCTVTAPLCAPCASRASASAGTQGHVQAGCTKLPKGSGRLISIRCLSVVSEKVCLSEKEAFCIGKVLAEIFERE